MTIDYIELVSEEVYGEGVVHAFWTRSPELCSADSMVSILERLSDADCLASLEYVGAFEKV